MPDNQTEIGARLKKIRLELGKNQEDFSAMLLGKSNKATISAYELGKMAIAPKALVVLFTTLNVNKEWLETGKGDMFARSQTPQYTKSATPKGKVGNWLLQMRNELYSKINSELPPSEIERQIAETQEELEFMRNLLEEKKKKS